MASVRILYGGGGDEQDSLPLHQLFVSWVGGGKVLYLPTALVDEYSMEAGLRWIKEALYPLGLTKIEAWYDLTHKTAADLAAFDAVYIGGGNTFYLLHQLRAHHLDSLLRDFILGGHPAFGGSAGAIVLAHDIRPSAHIDEDIVGLEDLGALDLALGYAVWCHYTPDHEAIIRGYVQESGVPSIALTERGGVYREGDQLIAAGSDPLLVFRHEGSRTVHPGERVDTAAGEK